MSATTIVSGAAFGAALTAAGVYQPSVILSQLQLRNGHMSQSFLTATAASAALVFLFQRLGYIKPSPRGFSSLGLFSPLDGNIVGGALLGMGMALSGACPGTVFSQVALNIESGWMALQGAIVGGLIFTGFIKPYIASRASAAAKETQSKPPLTIVQSLGLSYMSTLVLYEASVLALVGLTAMLTIPGPEAKLHPVIGGLFIAGAQLVSIVLRRSLIGTSNSFEEIGNWVWGVAKRDGRSTPSNSILFCSSVACGSWAVAYCFPDLAKVTNLAISPAYALAGGLLMAVGARTAGGCTSGHGISGISLLSTSSVVTMLSAFGTGTLVAKMLY